MPKFSLQESHFHWIFSPGIFGQLFKVNFRTVCLVSEFVTECMVGAPIMGLTVTVLYRNRPFARSGHMVRNKLHWDASYAVGLSKQRIVGLDWYEFLLQRAY